MPVVVTLTNGDRHQLDRSLGTDRVAAEINDARGNGKLVAFHDNRTPSRVVYVDPDQVVSIKDDGYAY